MRLLFIQSLLAVVASAAIAQFPEVTDVTANQFGSFVRIEYDLAGPSAVPLMVSFESFGTPVATFRIPAATIAGNAGTPVLPGAGRVALWDAATDLPASDQGDQRILARVWVADRTPVDAGGVAFSYVYAEGYRDDPALLLPRMPGFYVTPCPFSAAEAQPAVPQTLVDANPGYAFVVFQDTVAGYAWDDLRLLDEWTDEATAACTAQPGWRLAAFYWPSEPGAGIAPDATVRPFRMNDAPALSAPFALNTAEPVRDLDGDGIADDKMDLDQNGIPDAVQDFDGDGVADAFEDTDGDGVPDAYDDDAEGAFMPGFQDENGDHCPDFFASRLPLFSPTHPRHDRVYFTDKFEALLNPYQPGAAAYRWIISPEAIVAPSALTRVLPSAGPHLIKSASSDGLQYLHVLALDATFKNIPGSERRLAFTSALGPPSIVSETHAAPDPASRRRVFRAQARVPYGPRQWRSDSNQLREDFLTLLFRGAIWVFQPDGKIWKSQLGTDWAVDSVMEAWKGAEYLTGTVFRDRVWIHTSAADAAVPGTAWSSADGRVWQVEEDVPWANREAPTLLVFRDALYAFGGLAYPDSGLSRTVSPAWRSPDGEHWTQITEDAPWAAERAPYIVADGDLLWKDRVFFFNSPFLGSGPPLLRSWDGVDWLNANAMKSTSTRRIVRGSGNPSWRDDFHPWTIGLFAPFLEGLWFPGPFALTFVDYLYDADVWWFTPDGHAEAAASFDPLPALTQTAGISYAGRIQLIPDASQIPWQSPNGDNWYWGPFRNFGAAGLRLAIHQGGLWSLSDRLRRHDDLDQSIVVVNSLSRYDAGFVAFDGQLWILGGEAGGSPSDEILKSADGTTWTTVTDDAPWGARSGHSTVVHDGQIWLFGGSTSSGLQNDVWRSANGEDWTQVSVSGDTPWTPRTNAQALSYDGALWVIGGTDDTDAVLNDAWVSVDGEAWTAESSPVGPGPMTNGAAVVHQDSIYVTGYEDPELVAPLRRFGPAYVTEESIAGVRYVIDQQADTVPDPSLPLVADTFFEAEPLGDGPYMLHLVAVDSLGRDSAVLHTPFEVLPTPAPRVLVNGSTNPANIPANRFNVALSGNVPPGTEGTYQYGINLAPGGGAGTPTVGPEFALPCLAEGTYWLVAQSLDLYGFASEAAELEVAVSAPVALPPPSIHLAGLSAAREERQPFYPGNVVVTVEAAGPTEFPTRYVVDQRYGLPTNFDTAMESDTVEFTLPGMGVGRHFVHAYTRDICEVPSKEVTRSFYVRRRTALLVHFGPGTSDAAVELVWPAVNADGVAYRYVIDSVPDTTPDQDSPVTTDPSITLPVGEGAWNTYVHLAIEDVSGDLSEVAHIHLASDGENMVGLRGPFSAGRRVYYDVIMPENKLAVIDETQVTILPVPEGASFTMNSNTGENLRAQMVFSRTSDGPLGIDLPQGSVTYDGVPLPALTLNTTGEVDTTGPELLITAPQSGGTVPDTLVYTLTSPDAADLYLPPHVFSLRRQNGSAINATPQVQFENGVWQVTYTAVTLEGSVRLSVAAEDGQASNSLPYRCTGYDAVGNCIGAVNSPWIAYDADAPVLELAPPAQSLLGAGPVDYRLTLSEPVNSLDPNAVVIISDPPSAVAASVSVVQRNDLSYDVRLTEITGDGAIQLLLPTGFATDPAGNASAEVLSESRMVDTTPPTITMGTPIPPVNLGDPIVFPFETHDVHSTSGSKVALQFTGNAEATGPYVSNIGSENGTVQYEAVVTSYTGEGTIALQVNGDAFTDIAGNPAVSVVSSPVAVALYRLNITAVGLGTTDPPPGEYLQAPGTVTQVTAQPTGRGRFLSWLTGDDASTTTTINWIASMNATLQANFSDKVSHYGDQNENWKIELSELLRVIQFYNLGGLHCAPEAGDTEDGFVPGPGLDTTCFPHDSDYAPQNWIVSLSELLRLIQFYNTGGYEVCNGGEDGYCPKSA